MLEWISWIISSFLCIITYCNIFNVIILSTNQPKKTNLIIISLIYSVINATAIITLNPILKMIINFLGALLLLKIIYKETLSKTTIITFLIYIIFAVSETIYTSFITKIIGLDINIVLSNFFGIILSNIFINLISICIFKIKRFKMFVVDIVKWYRNKEIFNIVFLIIVAMTAMAVLIYPNSKGTLTIGNFLINLVIIIGITVLIFAFFRERTDKNKLSIEYDQLLECMSPYEKELTEKSKKQHEYKNQLAIIKDIIEKDKNKALKYIDNLLGFMSEDDSIKQVEILSKLPSGVLKGLFWYKIKQMEENNIEFCINVSKSLQDNKKWKVCENNLQDISKILGVYLDNAIEATANNINKSIIIDINYTDKSLIFEISNTYLSLDYNKIGKKGFTTKGKGHGYGLMLVKDIIDSNSNFKTESEINGIYYVKRLIVKNK